MKKSVWLAALPSAVVLALLAVLMGAGTVFAVVVGYGWFEGEAGNRLILTDVQYGTKIEVGEDIELLTLGARMHQWRIITSYNFSIL